MKLNFFGIWLGLLKDETQVRILRECIEKQGEKAIDPFSIVWRIREKEDGFSVSARKFTDKNPSSMKKEEAESIIYKMITAQEEPICFFKSIADLREDIDHRE